MRMPFSFIIKYAHHFVFQIQLLIILIPSRSENVMHFYFLRSFIFFFFLNKKCKSENTEKHEKAKYEPSLWYEWWPHAETCLPWCSMNFFFFLMEHACCWEGHTQHYSFSSKIIVHIYTASLQGCGLRLWKESVKGSHDAPSHSLQPQGKRSQLLISFINYTKTPFQPSESTELHPYCLLDSLVPFTWPERLMATPLPGA